MSSLAESSVLIDRALVTLCTELPESLGLYNTSKDQLSLAAIRTVPMLERLPFESRKHFIVRDWMRSYVPGEDQPLTNEISFDLMRETLKRERKERQRLEREQEAARDGGPLVAEDGKTKKKKKKKKDRKTKEKEEETTTANDENASEQAKREKKKKKAKKDASQGGSTERSGTNKAKPKSKSKQQARARSTRKHRSGSDDEDEFMVNDGDVSMISSNDSSSSSPSSSSSSSSSSESESSEEESKESEKSKSPRGKKRKKIKSNLPPIEVVLSSDEDEEPNEMFDEGDPDVYEVETILDKRPGEFGGEPEYLIKWVGYEETTWEPAANVSKDLVDEFEGLPVREDEYAVEEIRDRRSKRDSETRLKTYEYLVKWVGYEEQTWEPAENLPHNLRRKFDAKYEARKRRRR